MATVRTFLSSAIFVTTLIGTAAGQQCAGDCDGNGSVVINELILCVRISLDETPLAQCEECDDDGDSTVAINELVLAVTKSLASCAAAANRNPGDAEHAVDAEYASDAEHARHPRWADAHAGRRALLSAQRGR